MLAVAVLPSSRDIYTGHRNYEMPTPSVPGNAALGRIVAVGTDATKLQPGNLIFVDAVVRSRDDPTAAALSGISGGHSAASKRLIGTEGRDSTYVEYARVPLENSLSWMRSDCWARPSNGGLGYDLNGLLYRGVQLVLFGGLRAVGVGGGGTASSSVLPPALSGVRRCRLRSPWGPVSSRWAATVKYWRDCDRFSPHGMGKIASRRCR